MTPYAIGIVVCLAATWVVCRFIVNGKERK